MSDGLEGSLAVDIEDSAIKFTATVTNRSPAPMELFFPSAARLSVVVEDVDQRVLWDSSAGRFHAAVTQTIVLEPGGERSFDQTWASAKGVGATVVRARLHCTPPIRFEPLRIGKKRERTD